MHVETDDRRGNAAPTAATDPDVIDAGAPWRRRAAELADWVLPLVVREDCHGGHTIDSTDGRPVFRRTTRKSALTRENLIGHFAARDAALRGASRRMGTALRPYDALGRYGGEEFLIVLPGCDLPGALAAAERVRHAVAEAPVSTPSGMVPITVSPGPRPAKEEEATPTR